MAFSGLAEVRSRRGFGAPGVFVVMRRAMVGIIASLLLAVHPGGAQDAAPEGDESRASALERMEADLRAGLFAEEVERDLVKAAAAYGRVLDAWDAHRRLAATAAFRLAECAEAEGDATRAVELHRRIAREFADLPDLADLSRKRLADLGAAPDDEGGAPDSALPASAAEEAELALVRERFEKSPDLVNAADEEGRTPLTRAVAAEQSRIVAFLLEAGADVSIGTPLHAAAEKGNLAIGRLLLEAGADTERPLPPTLGMSDVTPLHVAVFHGHQAFAELLLAHDAAVDAVASAVLDRGHFTNPDRLRAAQELRRQRSGSSGDEGPTAGPVSTAPAFDFDDEVVPGTTALHIAVATGFGNLTELLLRAGADPGRLNGFGQGPLHLAARADSRLGVIVLLATGVSPDSLDHSGFSPVLIAARRGNEKMVDVLLAANARVEFDPAVHPHARSALVEAARGGNSEIVRRLIDRGADPMRTDPAGHGMTALHWAAFREDPDITTALLEAGADTEAVTGADWGARRPLHVAASYQHAEVIAALAQGGAQVEALDGRGETALVIASTDSNIPRAIPALLQAGANPRVRTAEGDDLLPAFLAQRRATGFSPIEDVRRLLEAGADPNGRLAQQRGGEYTDGMTPLHIAAKNNDAALTGLLLEFRADPTIQVNRGGVAFQLAPRDGPAARLLFEPTWYARPDRGEWISASFPDVLAFCQVFHQGPKDAENGNLLLPNEYSLLDLAIAAVQHNELRDIARRVRMDRIFTGRARILRLDSAAGGTRSDPTKPEEEDGDPDSTSATTGTTSIEIDLAAMIADGDPSRDVRLEWGDIVEFSLGDVSAAGLTADQTAFIDACTRRTLHATWTLSAEDVAGAEESTVRETLTVYPANWIRDDLTGGFRIDPSPSRGEETARLLPFATTSVVSALAPAGNSTLLGDEMRIGLAPDAGLLEPMSSLPQVWIPDGSVVAATLISRAPLARPVPAAPRRRVVLPPSQP